MKKYKLNKQIFKIYDILHPKGEEENKKQDNRNNYY